MILYRYERQYAFEYELPKLILRTYNTLSETKCGYWITEDYYGVKKRWVPKVGTKRFAYPTPEEALVNFKKRTKSCVLRLKAQLKAAEDFLYVAENKPENIITSGDHTLIKR